jgi:hypothetical protein
MTGNTIDLGVGTDTIKFTAATNADTVTVTNTTITGAKYLTYQKSVTAPAITTGAGADVLIFEENAGGAGQIYTNSGNDSIQFLKDATFTTANLGAGADSLYGAQVISDATISGAAGKDTFLISTLSDAAIYAGSDQDSIQITGSLYGATVDFGAGNELFTLSVGATGSTIAGGAGNDTFVVTGSNLQTASQISGGVGNDSVSFSGELSGGSVLGGSGQDTIRLSAVNNSSFVSADTGSDVLLFSGTVTSSAIYGGVGGDSMDFKGAISNSTIDFGADNDTATISVAATSATILGGAGADTLVFSSGANLVTSSVSGGADGDSLVFSATVGSASSIAGGGGNDTMVFNSSLSGAVVSLDSGADSVSFTTQVAGSSTLFGGGGIQTVQFSSAATDLVSLDGTFGAGSIMSGSGNDTLVFQANAAVNASTVIKLDAGDDSLTFNGNMLSGQFGGLAGADYIGGSVTVGNSGVSFWGGSGNDTFSFSTITNVAGDAGTAYFWNEGGADSIVLGSVVSMNADGGGDAFGTVAFGAASYFGITSGASMNISFQDAQTSQMFGYGISNSFDVHNTLVTYGVDANNYITLSFVGGGTMELQGFSSAEATAITNSFDLAGGAAGARTANFGTATAIPTFS